MSVVASAIAKGTSSVCARVFAKRVFPVPGGPTSRTPFGIFAPNLLNFSGDFRNSLISSSSSLASSTPATSLKVTFGDSSSSS